MHELLERRAQVVCGSKFGVVKSLPGLELGGVLLQHQGEKRIAAPRVRERRRFRARHTHRGARHGDIEFVGLHGRHDGLPVGDDKLDLDAEVLGEFIGSIDLVATELIATGVAKTHGHEVAGRANAQNTSFLDLLEARFACLSRRVNRRQQGAHSQG